MGRKSQTNPYNPRLFLATLVLALILPLSAQSGSAIEGVILEAGIISDVNGKYELRGIAPGSYHLFAWTELEGGAYRNADFMKEFEGMGTPIKIEAEGRRSQNVQVIND